MTSEAIDIRRTCGRVMALGLAVLLVQGCATMQHEGGAGSLLPDSNLLPSRSSLVSIHPGASPSDGEWKQEADARHAEVESVLARMSEVATRESHVGAVLEFTFWVERGAFTLLSFRDKGGGAQTGPSLTPEDFAQGLRGLLLTLAETRTGALNFTLHREQRRWRADYSAVSLPAPPEARPQPARRLDDSDRTHSAARHMTESLVRLLQVPSGASAHLSVDFTLDDDRFTGWEPGPYAATQGGQVRPADEPTAKSLSSILLPFTRGLGPRTVRLELSGTHDGRSATSLWRVEQAQTLRPVPMDKAVEDVLHDYRLLHATLFHRYREEMVDSVMLAGSFTLEQLALCAVGGLLGKGLHVAFEAVAPTVMRVVTRGGGGALRWFRTQLVRAGRADQELLRRLWAKIEMEGFEALSAAERNELTRLLSSMEQALSIKLNDKAKDALRAKARKDFYSLLHPELERILKDVDGTPYDVHHLVPLEYAHLFPELDVNSAGNLKALDKPIHKAINKIWSVLRKEIGDTARPEQVQRVAEITQQHFERWFNQVYDSKQSALLLEEATNAALNDVRLMIGR